MCWPIVCVVGRDGAQASGEPCRRWRERSIPPWLQSPALARQPDIGIIEA